MLLYSAVSGELAGFACKWLPRMDSNTLNRILHGCGKFSVSASELFQQHVAQTRIRLVHVNRVHEFFDVMVHNFNVCYRALLV